MKSLSPLLFYSPVHPDYDFDLDQPTSDTEIRRCGYEVCKEELCSGLLISKTMLDDVSTVVNHKTYFEIHARHRERKFYKNIRSFLHLRKKSKYVVLADPGTWSYVNSLELPDFLLDPEVVFRYYNSLRFDLGGSVDWPIVDKVRVRDNLGKVTFRELSYTEKEHRRNLTIELAKLFVKKCRSKDKINFVPFGTAQGYSVSTYLDSLRKILKMGYKYVAIGGLPSYSEKKVLELLPHITKCISKYGRDKNVGMHLYGRFPSPNAVLPFAKAGVTSFDNNYSYICSSRTKCTFWGSEFKDDKSYQTPNYECYNVKIPSERGKAICLFKRKADSSDLQVIMNVTNACYNRFVIYNCDQSSTNRKKFIKSYKKMYSYFKEYGVSKLSDTAIEKIVDVANNSLQKKVWKRCGCTSCKKLGAHIVLMRGSRIPYTFFHNSYVQYYRFIKECSTPEVQKYLRKYNWETVSQKRKENVKDMKVK